MSDFTDDVAKAAEILWPWTKGEFHTAKVQGKTLKSGLKQLSLQIVVNPNSVSSVPSVAKNQGGAR